MMKGLIELIFTLIVKRVDDRVSLWVISLLEID